MAEIVTVEVQAENGHLKFAEDLTHLWQGVQILSYDTVDESKSNVTKPSLNFIGTLTLINSALQALRYQGESYYNGNDFIKLKIYNKNLEGSSKDILVMLQAKNDPPFINSSSSMFLNASYWKAVNDIPIKGLSIGDPDLKDTEGKNRALYVQISLEVDSRSIEISINSSAISTISSQKEGSNLWITQNEQDMNEDKLTVVGRIVKFKDTIGSCNNALESLKLVRGKPKGLKSILLTITVNDLGNFGCFGDCTSNVTIPLQSIRHMSLDFEYLPPDIRAKVAASVTCSLIFVVYITILLVRYRRSLAYGYDDGFLSEKDMLTKTRVFNPAWSMDAKRESTFDFGVSKFAVGNEDSLMGNLFDAPIEYEDIPHDAESDSLLIQPSEENEPPRTISNKKPANRRNRFILDD